MQWQTLEQKWKEHKDRKYKESKIKNLGILLVCEFPINSNVDIQLND